jgi:hypothetical protein
MESFNCLRHNMCGAVTEDVLTLIRRGDNRKNFAICVQRGVKICRMTVHVCSDSFRKNGQLLEHRSNSFSAFNGTGRFSRQLYSYGLHKLIKKMASNKSLHDAM